MEKRFKISKTSAQELISCFDLWQNLDSLKRLNDFLSSIGLPPMSGKFVHIYRDAGNIVLRYRGVIAIFEGAANDVEFHSRYEQPDGNLHIIVNDDFFFRLKSAENFNEFCQLVKKIGIETTSETIFSTYKNRVEVENGNTVIKITTEKYY